MNRSKTAPRSFSSNQLRAALGDVGGRARPEYLADIVAEAGRTRQRPAWTFLERWLPVEIAVGRQGVPRSAIAVALLFLLLPLLAAGAVYVGSLLTRPERLSGLPATPSSWERVPIQLPSGHTGSVASLASTPQGLLAVVSWGNTAQLAISTDGRNWTVVPDGQHPSLDTPGGFGYPSIVGTDRGFLMLNDHEVWMSENGYNWRRIGGGTTDQDLRLSAPDAVVASGPGLVGVGDDKAWYSVDGSDWSLAKVPAVPAAILAAPDSDRYVAMTGVTAAGNDLVAWGEASVPVVDQPDEHLVVPLLWASQDGRRWTDVVKPDMVSVTAVTGGPRGFIAAGQTNGRSMAWSSADGHGWEQVDLVDPRSVIPGEPNVESAAATGAGYVLVGGGQSCLRGACSPSAEAAIWTSPDGRAWSHLPSDERFARAAATDVIAFGSHFVAGGVAEDRPVIWISH
jgi:hypothetical protein